MTTFTPPRILYVGVDKKLKRFLEEETARRGHLFEDVESREKGLSVITEGVFDIVFIDNDLKDKRNFDFIEDLSLSGILPPTIFFAGKGQEIVIAKILKLGVKNYIVKDRKQKYMELIPVMIDKVLNEGWQVVSEYQVGHVGQVGSGISWAEKEKTAILDSISEMVMYIGNDMKVIWANKAVAKSVGSASRELLGHRCYHVLLNNIEICEGCPVVKTKETHESSEAEIVSEDGKIWFVRAYPVMDDNGEVEGVVEVKRDITAQREWEGNLKEASNEWRTTFDSITDMVSIVDRDYRFVKVNRALSNFLNTEPKNLIGKICHSELYDKEKPCEDCPHTEIISTGKPVAVERFDPHLGTHLLLSASPIVDEDGEVVGSAIIKKDISEQKNWENKLKQASDEWRATFDSITDMVAIIDTNYEFVKANKALSDSFNIELKQLVGKKCYEVMKGIDTPCEDCFHKEALLTGKGVQQEKFDERLGMYLQISVSLIFNDSGDAMGTAIIFKDISKRKEAEEKLKEYSKHLKQMVGNLSQELKEAPELLVNKAKINVLRQLARGVGSELRGPLEIISKKIFSLKKRIPKEDKSAQKSLETIASEIKKTEQIMLLLLYFARPKTPNKKETNVQELVLNVLEKYPPAGNIRVIPDIPNDLPRVFVDPIQTGQVINNLIVNADQLMADGGELKIIASLDERGVSLSISDNAPSIPKQNLKKLFDPLSTTSAGKMGIGLAISKNLIESNGGEISVMSKEGKGNTFTILLPIKK